MAGITEIPATSRLGARHTTNYHRCRSNNSFLRTPHIPVPAAFSTRACGAYAALGHAAPTLSFYKI